MATTDAVPALTARQREILAHVVEEHIRTGQPVGSKHLVESAGLAVSSSTVRNVLAELEALGLLTHPHTSAGRVPTEAGFRFYAAAVADRRARAPRRRRSGNRGRSVLDPPTCADA